MAIFNAVSYCFPVPPICGGMLYGMQVFEKEHVEEIAEIIGNCGVWFNTEVLIAIGEKP